jgi:phosphodiesterase/alkaline phosphatase D-like protein
MSYVRIGPLVRATTATEATIWLELSQPCTVQLQVTPYNTSDSEVVTSNTPAITIGGHYYAAPQITHLQSATWYNYHLSIAGQEQDSSLLQCFRTLTPSTAQELPLRLIYGSCRKLSCPEEDTLAAFGRWLQKHAEERETLWPHLLLLIGDQIYADQPARELVTVAPQVRQGATSFEDFTHFYRHAWTNNEGTRQALAALPIYMTPDDHELTNSWNTWPTWYAELAQQGKEQIIVDGLVAYWVYQGWGNLSEQERQQHPLAQMMQAATQSGQDIIEELRAYIRTAIEEQTEQRWHYQIPTTPPIFVTNARADRTEIIADNQKEQFKPLHIMGKQQMADLSGWLAERQQQPAIIVSSVPVILPPIIGLAEYLTGIRLWSKSIAPLRWIGERLARLQLYLARRLKFDHWPIYSASWKELLQAVRTHPGTTLLLSGDVHFSYTAEGRVLFSRSRACKKRLYQLVSTPIENTLSYGDMRLIKGQSLIPRMIYGGLDTRMLPLEITASDVHTLRHLLFENTLAYITLQPDTEGHYTIQQDYYGLVNGRLEVIARITLP